MFSRYLQNVYTLSLLLFDRVNLTCVAIWNACELRQQKSKGRNVLEKKNVWLYGSKVPTSYWLFVETNQPMRHHKNDADIYVNYLMIKGGIHQLKDQP